MAKAKESHDANKYEWKMKNNNNMSGCGMYGVGFIGAAAYFIQHAQTFSDGVVGVLKAAVWPAFLVYKLLELLKF